MNVYKRLRLSCKDSNGKPMSLRAFSKEVGILPSHLSEIENGIKKPSFNEIKKYHDYFAVSMELLLEDGEDPEGIVANKEDVRFSMYALKKADTSAEILMKQTVELLFGTSTGQAILYQLSELLFGIENQDLKEGEYVKGEAFDELYKITHENIEDIAQQLVNELVLLRDPKFRKASVNELKMVVNNCCYEVEDKYSHKIKLA